MVERLKQAIEKARAQRDGAAAMAGPSPVRAAAPATLTSTDKFWNSLEEIQLSAKRLEAARVVTFEKANPAHVPFDLLRTRLIKVLRDNNWRRIAIVSPTKGCGKTLVAVNLAFSFARQPDIRTLLVDMDLRSPEIANVLGHKDAPQIERLLEGKAEPETALVRVGETLALALNRDRVRNSTELIQDEKTAAVLGSLNNRLEPDIVIYDLPPMLVCDDALAFMRHVDCVLMVAGAGQSTAREIEECERMLGETANFLGVLLNKSEDKSGGKGYEYY